MLGDFPLQTMIPAADLARARAFYADTLGLKVVHEHPEEIEFESGGARFGVYPTRVAAGSEATIAGWSVEDLDAEVQELRARGVTFEDYDIADITTVDGIVEIDGERAAWFRDSEGNVLAVSQRSTP
jgi:catechol 2,3-dioxygenase-like lactoylglutathione lyase family enzyme